MTDDRTAEDVRRFWGVPELSGLWQRAREVLEQPEQPATFRLELPDDKTRNAVGHVYGRTPTGLGTRLNVSKLDDAVRGSRFGLDLAQVLEILHERPVTRRASPAAERDERRNRVSTVLGSALAEHGLDRGSWVEAWIRWWHQYGRIAEDELELTARRAAGVLARLVLDPTTSPATWISRADLAAPHGGAHQLDSGTSLSRVVLKAAALAHDTEVPGRERGRRALWERVGVILDSVSTTALCWALPLAGNDTWSRGVADRTAQGLPAHVTHRDLVAAPREPVREGSVIAVCENPRVLEAAMRDGITHPVVCVSGQPTTVALQLLDRLVASGAILRYHGDFDWAGVSILSGLWASHQVLPWRMGAEDYREELDRAARDRVDLPQLIGTPVETPWDPALRDLMADVGQAIEEEVVLPTLLSDLKAGLAAH